MKFLAWFRYFSIKLWVQMAHNTSSNAWNARTVHTLCQKSDLLHKKPYLPSNICPAMSTIVYFFDFCPLQYSHAKKNILIGMDTVGCCNLQLTWPSSKSCSSAFPWTIRAWEQWEFYLTGNKVSAVQVLGCGIHRNNWTRKYYASKKITKKLSCLCISWLKLEGGRGSWGGCIFLCVTVGIEGYSVHSVSNSVFS